MTSGPPRVLIVEDALVAQAIATKRLSAAGFAPEVVPDLHSALRRLAEVTFDAVLLDLGLPDSDGLETVRRVVEAFPEVPMVVLTGTDDDAQAIEAMRLGAQDYIVKSTYDVDTLARSVRYARERHALQVRLRKLEADRLEATAAALRAEQLREFYRLKTEILNSTAHELCTPLTPIKTEIHILRGKGAPVGSLDRLERNVARLDAVVQDLIRHLGATEGQLQEAPLWVETVEDGRVVHRHPGEKRP